MIWKFFDGIVISIAISPGVFLIIIQADILSMLQVFLTLVWFVFISFILGMAFKSYVLEKKVKELEKLYKDS